MRDLVELKVSDPVADTFIIADIEGDPETATRSVLLNSIVTKEEDALEMRFRNEGHRWSEWEPYSKTKTWNLSYLDGLKTVYAEYRDEGHHVVPMVNNIVLNTGAPTGNFYIFGNGIVAETYEDDDTQHEYINTVNVTLCMNITNVASMRFSNNPVDNNDTAWDAVSPLIPFSEEYDWTLNSSEGLKTVYAQFKTNAGISTYSTNSSVDIHNPGDPDHPHQPVLDMTAPAVSNIKINGGVDASSTAVDFEYYLAETDYEPEHKMWAEYRNDGESWKPKVLVTEGHITVNDWLLRSEIGTRTVYIRLSDIAGNVSPVYSADVILNTAAPAAPEVTAVTPVQTMHPTWTWNSVPGAVSYKYSVDGSPWADNGTVTSYTPTTALMYNMSHTLEVTAVDSEGRESEIASADVYIDTEGPSVSSFNFVDLLGKIGDTITIGFTLTDVSGISGTPEVTIGGIAANISYSTNYTAQYSVTPGSPSGTFDLVITATDNAGNTTERILPNLVTIDSESPVINSFSINNGNTYSCSPVMQAAFDVQDYMTSNGDLLIRLNGNSYLPPYEVYSAEGVVTLSVRDEAGNTSSDSASITRKSGTDDIRFENQSHPSNSGAYAYDLGNMSKYVDGGDHAEGSTQTLEDSDGVVIGGAKNLWDEDWYKIYIDGGTSPYFLIDGLDSSIISGIIKIEVYYDEDGTEVAPSTYTDNGTNLKITLTDDFDGTGIPKEVWIKVYKDPSAADYTGAEYFLEWWIGYM